MPGRRTPRTTRGWFHRRVPWWAVPVVVVAVLLAGEVGARIVGPEIPRKAGSEERLLIKSDQVFDRGTGSTDVIVLGSSETAGGLVPSIADAEVAGLDGMYNAALSGASVELTHEWADRVVAPHLQPEVAVIGMLPIAVLSGDFVSDQRGLAEPQEAIDAYRAALDQVDPGGFRGTGWELRQRSALVRWRPYLRSPSQVARGVSGVFGHGPTEEPDDGRPVDWRTETDPARILASTGPDGAIADYHSSSLPVDEDPIGAALYDTFAKGTVDLSALQDLVDGLRDRGITPVIALAPVDRLPLIGGGADLAPLDDLVADIEAWAAERDVPVDDQVTETWSPELFHDRNHLDEDGAAEWSAHVGRWLQDLCTDGTLQGCGPA